MIKENEEQSSHDENVLPNKQSKPKNAQRKVTFKMAIDLNNYQKIKMIGEGNFGKVYIIEEKSTGKQYCAKISKKIIEDNSLDELLNLLTEVSLFSRFDHPCIAKFIGYSTVNFKGTHKPVIIMEYLPNGTLKKAISLESMNRALNGWDDTHKLINIYGIASAMSYLHSHDILHRDLKTDNILLDNYLYPRVVDFGLSKISTESDEDNKNMCGTPLYMAPEIIREKNYTKAGDVYAFGLIVYEIVTNKTPFEDEVHNFIDIIKKVAIEGQRPKIDECVNKSYRELIEKCWKQDPKDRISFDEIVNNLENNKDFITPNIDENDYMNYIYYIKDYQVKFDKMKPAIPVRYKMANSKDSRLTNELEESGIKNENELYKYAGKRRAGVSMTGGKNEITYSNIKQKADNGDVHEMYRCGDFLYQGNHVKMNKELASYYFKKGADLGSMSCALRYANMLYKSDGISYNFDEALKYYKILAEYGDREGTYKYAKILLNKNYSAVFNVAEGLKYLDKAVRLHSVEAAFLYGNIFYNGDYCVNVDKQKAYKYFKIASNGGNIDAKCKLAMMLMNGDGVPVDKQIAIQLFYDVANKGNQVGIDNYFKLLNEGVNDGEHSNKTFGIMEWHNDYTFKLGQSTEEMMRCDSSVYLKHKEHENNLYEISRQNQSQQQIQPSTSECCLLI